MITSYHLGNSRSERIVWFMEQLGLLHDPNRFDRGPDSFATRDPKRIRHVGVVLPQGDKP